MRRSHRVSIAIQIIALPLLATWLLWPADRAPSASATPSHATGSQPPKNGDGHASPIMSTPSMPEPPRLPSLSTPAREVNPSLQWELNRARVQVENPTSTGRENYDDELESEFTTPDQEGEAARGGADSWVTLDPVSLEPGKLSVRAAGFDSGAPRALSLWRFEGNESARLSGTISNIDGNFDFGPVLVPLQGIHLVVTEERREPEAGDFHGALDLEWYN